MDILMFGRCVMCKCYIFAKFPEICSLSLSSNETKWYPFYFSKNENGQPDNDYIRIGTDVTRIIKLMVIKVLCIKRHTVWVDTGHWILNTFVLCMNYGASNWIWKRKKSLLTNKFHPDYVSKSQTLLTSTRCLCVVDKENKIYFQISI